MTQTTSGRESGLDQEPLYSFVEAEILKGEMNSSIARKLFTEFNFETSRDSIRRFRRRHDIQIPGAEPGAGYTKVTGDGAEAQTRAKPCSTRHMFDPPVLDDPDQMLIDRGLNPEDWRISDAGIGLNTWDGPQVEGNIVTYYQAKFRAVRRGGSFLEAVRSDGWTRPVQFQYLDGPSELIVVCGDHQAPFHDKRLHALFLQWLAKNRPHRGVNLGDLMDYPDVSRHPDDPVNVAKARECQQAGYDIMRGIADASPSTLWEWLPGNHDTRLYDYLVKNAPRALEALHRVDTPEDRGYALAGIDHILRCDELGVKFIDPKGPYDLAQVTLSKNLAVRHGWLVRAKGGESAYQTLMKTGYSILVGHTHRQAIVQHTVPEIDGTPRQLLAAEIGCMCRNDGENDRDEQGRRFPAYTPMADWQRGFATVEMYPDGLFKVDLATYVNGVLLWRSDRYE